jgi:DNA repair ATPase RecN
MSHHKIRRLNVTDGFLGGLDVTFKDGLICLIGGRGSGKTTILELLRYALNRQPHEDGARKAASKRFRTLIEANLGRGAVEVEFETQDGIVYHVERRVGEDPIVSDANGETLDSAILDSGIQIDAAIFSQNEVEEIAMKPDYLRDVLDRFCTRELTDIQRRIEQTKSALQRNSSEVVQLSIKSGENREALKNLPELETRLQALNEELKEAKLPANVEAAAKLKSLRTQESAALTRIKPALEDATETLAPLQNTLIGEFKQVFSEDVLNGPNGAIFQDLRQAMLTGVDKFRNGIKQAEEALAAMTEAGLSAVAMLKKAQMPQESAYQDLLKQSAEHQQRLRERDKLAKQVAQLHTAKEEADRIEKRLGELAKERKRLLADYSSEVEARFRLRESVAEDLTSQLSDTIRVKVAQGADREAYRQFLVKYRDPSIREYNPSITKIVNSLSPVDLAALVESRKAEELAVEAEIDERFALGVLNGLAADLRSRFELELITLDDVPSIELFVCNEWRVSSRLSTGQMCSVVLPLLLLDSVAPLVIDQPEDNLDNRFVTDNVAEMVARNQDRRQMIFITHNPNIPVMGQASQVVVMDASDGKGEKVGEGSVDEMKDKIIELLEGGERAFQARREKYGW